MDRSFQIQEQKKNSLSRPGGLRSTTLLQNEIGNPLHSTILSMQQSYGNRYVQELFSGERMPCAELCGLSEPLVAAPTRPAAQFKPHSCDSCVFHPQKSVKRAVTGVSNPTGGVPLQAKLTIGQPGDVYEQEADSVADMILQRQCTTPECEEEEIVQRQIDEEEDEPLQMRQMVPAVENSQDITEQILHQKGSGKPLEQDTRKFMESRFGYDFGEVRVHTDSQAGEMARDLNAEAFTVGRNVYFGSGRYNPVTNSGQRLLAHELTHLVQQGKVDTNVPGIQLQGEGAGGGAASADHRFTAEGVSVVVRRRCSPADFGFATVETATRDALDKIFNTDCIEESRRSRIQRNLTRHGLDIRCRRSIAIDGACAEATGYNIPANIMTLGSKRFPGHPDYDPGGCPPPLSVGILHEIVHLTRGIYAEGLPNSCVNSCFGVAGASPDLCRDIDVFGKRVRSTT